MSDDVEMRIAPLAARQHGAVTQGQLMRAGSGGRTVVAPPPSAFRR